MKKRLLPIMLLAFLGMAALSGCTNNSGGGQGGGGGEDNPPVVETVDVTGVTLDKTELSLVKGTEQTLVATVAPANATDKGVSWKSSNTSVATVENGKVSAVDVGNAVITVTTNDGGFAAKCNVSVTLHFDALTITNKAEFADGLMEGENKALSITTDPVSNIGEMLSNHYLTISSSNDEVASTRGTVVYANGAGTARITVQLFDASDEFELTVTAKPTNKDRFGTEHDGTAEDPFTNEDALIAAKYLEANGGFGTTEYYFKGEVETFYHAPGSRDDGVVSWYMKPAQEGGEKFEIYKCLGADGKTPLGKTDIWKGAVVTAHGPFDVYKDKGQYETSYAVFDGAEGEKPVDPITIEATVAETISAGLLLADGDQSWDTYVITGYVVKKSGSNFFLADTKDADVSDDKALFELYGVAEKDQENLLKGAKIKATCEIKNYHGQIENGTKPQFELLEAGESWEVPVPESYHIVNTPEANTNYKIGLATAGSDLGSDIFFTATLNDSGYGVTATKFSEGAEFQLVEVEGGYNLKVVGETAKFVNFIENGTGKAKLEIADAASTVFTYNADARTLVATVAEVNFYAGTYTSKGSTYNTISVSKLDYISGDNAEKIDVSQFPIHFYAEGDAPVSYRIINAPAAERNYKIGLATKSSDLAKDLFFTATLNDSGYGVTSEKFGEGAEFQLIEVTGGYNLKVVGETAKFVNFVANGTGKAKLELADAASSVFTFNADARTLVTTVDGAEFYMGTYTSKGSTYPTISVSKLDYISGDNAAKIDISQFPAHLYEEGEEGVVELTGVKLNKETLVLEIGDTYTLSASPVPAYAQLGNGVLWSTSNDEIATVENGLVTAVGAGEATITVTVGELTATCVVTVNAPAAQYETLEVAIAASSFTGDNSLGTFTSGIATFTLDKNTSSTNNRYSDTDHLRIYKNAKFSIALSSGSIAKVELTVTADSYAAEANFVLGEGYGINIDGTVVKLTVPEGAEACEFVAGNQVRINNVKIYYVAGGSTPVQPVDPTIAIMYDGVQKCLESHWLDGGFADAQYDAAEFDIDKLTAQVTPEGAQVSYSYTYKTLDSTADEGDPIEKPSNPLAPGVYTMNVVVTASETVNAGFYWAGFVIKESAQQQISAPQSVYLGTTNVNDASTFICMAFAGENTVYVEIGSDKVTTTYTFNSQTGLITVALGGNYGNLTATFDEANNALVNVGIDGAAAALVSGNGEISLTVPTLFWNCDEDVNTTFARRIRPDGNWQAELTDVELETENFVSGSGAVARDGSTSYELGLTLRNAFAESKNLKGIGFWVYNPSNSDITFRTWTFANTTYQNGSEIGNMVAKANGWTFCRMGFSARSLNNFNICDWNKTGVRLVFDNIFLY